MSNTLFTPYSQYSGSLDNGTLSRVSPAGKRNIIAPCCPVSPRVFCHRDRLDVVGSYSDTSISAHPPVFPSPVSPPSVRSLPE